MSAPGAENYMRKGFDKVAGWGGSAQPQHSRQRT